MGRGVSRLRSGYSRKRSAEGTVSGGGFDLFCNSSS